MLARLALAPLLGAVQVPAPPEVALEWAAPKECPDREAVLTAIARRLGRPLTAEEAEVEARVVRDGGRGFTLRLRLSAGERGETREVSDPSCAALADVVAVLVAAAVEPAAAVPEPVPAEAVAPAPEPVPTEAVAPEPAPPEPSEPLAEPIEPIAPPASEPVPPRRSKGPGGFVRVHGGGEIGAVPQATGAVGLAGGLLWPRWRLELQGLYLVPQEQELPHLATTVRVALAAGAVHGCARLGRGAVEVPVCVGLEAGAMRGEARGPPSGRAAFQGWFGGVLGGGVVWHAGARLGLWAAVQMALTPVRPRFELSNATTSEQLWLPGPVSGRLLLGVEIRLRDPW
ncbi:hypothetical protein [Nannocystis radixulma]|uniref:Uncharacterized protein n=1 Tax=Nannocystis radixulma TaxID=2995305 RepID=A0ABT5BHN1_9BACT|nr:hypothetical protein [Nannocystis radixulma]MDC0672923.1 hypothetical protein [Nannocystis radixulma]